MVDKVKPATNSRKHRGAAIFLRNGSLTVEASTIAHNFGDLGMGITVLNDNKDIPTSFTLHNTIIDVKNGFGNFPCFYFATTAEAVAFTSAGNLITGSGAPLFNASVYPQLSDCTVGTVSRSPARNAATKLSRQYANYGDSIWN